MRTLWPMGCKKIETDAQLEALLTNGSYIGQEKLDGVRALLHVMPDGSFRFTTRGATLKDPDQPIEITHRLPHLTRYRTPSLNGAVLDGELIDVDRTSAEVAGIVNFRSEVTVPKTIHFYIFDIIMYPGRDLRDTVLRDRLAILRKLSRVEDSIPEFHIVPVVYDEKKEQLLHRILSSGKEGIVLKNLMSTYWEDKKKAGTWYKFKKKDTVDVVITGSIEPEHFYRDPDTGVYDFNRVTKPWANGWIGAISFKFKDKDGIEHTGSCSGLSDEVKTRISDKEGNIKPELIGGIMEVEFMEKTSDGNLRHPRFVRFRHEIEKRD